MINVHAVLERSETDIERGVEMRGRGDENAADRLGTQQGVMVCLACFVWQLIVPQG